MTEAKGKRIIKYINGEMVDYTLYELVDKYDKILWTKLDTFDFSRPPIHPRKLAVSLLETMIQRHGIGLAANQVGLPYRVFVMGSPPNVFVCYNPEIIDAVGESTEFDEGCLSYPGLFLNVKRASHIKLRYQDEEGKLIEAEFDGLTARIAQHEIDHLNGTSFIKRVPAVSLKRAQGKVKSNMKRIKDQIKAARASGGN